MTLKDIAQMVGTSPSTVSRVLNNTSGSCASPELRDRIWEAARATGYVPNETARSLRKGGSEAGEKAAPAPTRVAIVLARVRTLDADPFFSELFRNIEQELMAQGATIAQVVYAKDAPGQELVEADGVIIVGRSSRRLLEYVTALCPNVVGIWRNPMDFDVDEVVCDGRKAAEQAMGHLFDLGHRRIAYVGDCSYESRYIGYCNMLIQGHVPMSYELVRQTDQTTDAGRAAMRELLAAREAGRADFSAVFCANDATAVGVLEVLEEAKLPEGERVSVISIDDVAAAQETTPYLTTIHIPRDEMAHLAVVLLLDRARGGHRESVRIELPGRIVERESCWPVA